MRILIVGAGGREHALAWKISQSPLVEKLWVAPGNPGTAAVAENLEIAADDLDGITAFATKNQVGLAIIGPEGPLEKGLADQLQAAGVLVFGPRADAAEFETSKAFCKELLIRHRIPTAAFRVYSELNPAVSYLEGGARYPVVVKASGLAAGKGVVICPDFASARHAVKSMLEDGIHGTAGQTVLVEEFIDGSEASAFAITDGRTLVPLEICQDHKTLREGGKGPNTGGMGSICPTPEVGNRARDAIEREILVPALHGLNHEGRRFTGVLFAGLKLTPAGPKVLEFNVRFGDPECQVLMLRIQSDLLPLLHAAAAGQLDSFEAPTWDPRPAVTVVMASEGYPGSYATGREITGLDDLELGADLQVFHAGTALEDGRLVTAGGRVLAVTALGEDLAGARQRAYEAVERIQFQGATYRRDIGLGGLRALEAAT